MKDREIKNRSISIFAIPLRMIYRFIKKVAFPQKPHIKHIKKDGIHLLIWTNEEIGKNLVLRRSYEENNLKVFSRFVEKGDVCVDVGGNIGYYGLNFAEMCGTDGKVFIFEPIEKNARMIQLASLLNEYEHVFIHQKVVSHVNGTVEFIVPNDSAYAFMKPVRSNRNDDGYSGEKKRYQSITLDQFVSDMSIDRISILKIDVEGAEGLVLKGAEKILSNPDQRPKIIMIELVNEYLAPYHFSVDQVIGYLNQWGYKPFWADSSGQLNEYYIQEDQGRLEVFFL